MLTLYFIILGVWAFCAGMTLFTTFKRMETNIIWLIAMWIAWAAVLIAGCLL